MTLPTVTHRVPRQIIAGDSIEFLAAVPADFQAWTGSARLTGPAQMDATSVTLVGSDFRVRFAGQATGSSGTYKTAQLLAGEYRITVWATSGTDRVTLIQAPISVVPDLSTGTPTEPHCVVMLRAIEAAIKARITGNGDGGLESYAIDGTSVTKVSMDVLQRERKRYAAEVSALQSPQGEFGRVKFAFTPAGFPADARRRFD